MSQFLYIVAEGVQDVAFIGKLLVVVHKAKRVLRMEDLTTDHIAWMKTFSWPLPATSAGTDIGRFSVPAPTFYKLDSGAIVVLRSAEGIDKIFSTLERDLESFARTSGDPQTVGILLDSDEKTSQERLHELKKQLARLELDIPDDLGSVSGGVPRIGVFAVPAPGVEGTLEDLLLMIGEVSYPELSQSALAYANGWRDKAKAGLSGSEWKPIKKPAGAKKAAIAAMAAILKPGYATQVSIEQSEWFGEKTRALPCLQPCIAFLNALLATVTPAPLAGPSAPALDSAS